MAISVPMKAQDAYLAALDLTYTLASVGWDEIVSTRHEEYSKMFNDVKAGYACLTGPDDEYRLQNKHVALGFLQIMNTLESHDRYVFTKASLYLGKTKAAVIAVGPREPDESVVATSAANVTVSETSVIRNDTESRALTAAGKIVDPEDSRFVISYKTLDGRISCRALLNAALNGMAQSGEADDDDRCINFAGFGFSSKVTYLINSTPPGTSMYLLTYVLVRTAFKLLPAKLYEEKTCREVRFDLTYSGESLGVGSFVLSDFQTENGVAVS